jgi:hypothetical protein
VKLTIYFHRQKRSAVACKKLSEILDYWMDFDVLGIDEG